MRQKLQPLQVEYKETTVEEVSQLLEASFIHLSHYPKLLAKVVMVHKGDGWWRMCVDFTNLIKTYPKDSYLLLLVDALVEKSSGCKLLSFMDAHFGYNQVIMSRDFKENTSFIIEEGTFCFKIMPFSLQNVRAAF